MEINSLYIKEFRWFQQFLSNSGSSDVNTGNYPVLVPRIPNWPLRESVNSDKLTN